MTDKKNENLPATPETTNILNAAQQDAGFEQMMKFKKGVYECDGVEIKVGTKMTAHVIGWTKCWIKFKDQKVVERKIYRVAKGEFAPDRSDLDEKDEKLWALVDKRPQDPWSFQYLVPMENENGDIRIFVTSSYGGRRAVGDLATAYGRRAQQEPNCGQPVVKLDVAQMPTKSFGTVARPQFTIIGWNDGGEGVRDFSTPSGPLSDEALKKADFNDEIPF